MEIVFTPIGFVHSPYKDLDQMPRQKPGQELVQGSIEILNKYTKGLKDLDGFSHIIVLWHIHKAEGYDLTAHPPIDTEPRGLFSTRSPRRPNPIGLSVVKLLGVEGNILHIEGLDILDGTPVLDIKPYDPDFSEPQEYRLGWLGEAKARNNKK